MYITLEVFKVLVVLVVLAEAVVQPDQPYVQTKTEVSLSTITLEEKSTPEVAEVVAEVMVVLVVKAVLEVLEVMVVILLMYLTFLSYKDLVSYVVPDSILILMDKQ